MGQFMACKAIMSSIQGSVNRLVNEMTQRPIECVVGGVIAVGGSALSGYGVTYLLIKATTPYVAGSVAAVANLITLIATVASGYDQKARHIFAFSSASVVILSLSSIAAGLPVSIPTILMLSILNTGTILLAGKIIDKDL